MLEIVETAKGKTDLSFVVENAEKLSSIADELFDETHVEVRPDPEMEEAHYVVFSVKTSGEPREVADRRREWHKRTAAVLGDHRGKVQLLIDIIE